MLLVTSINDKPTAVVGQQPFGGARVWNKHKAGSPLNLLRWVSPRTKKLL
jgi:1-pyrroline-5-carboxylate dehydrogenase